MKRKAEIKWTCGRASHSHDSEQEAQGCIEAAKALSMDERVSAVREAVWRMLDRDRLPGETWDMYPVEVHEAYVIVRHGLATWRVSYEIADAGGVELQPRTAWQQVEKEWLEKATLVTFGGEVKALGGGKVGGYLVRFSSEEDTDLTGEFFTSETDFVIEDGQKSAVYYQHGLDPTLKQRKLGSGTLKKDDVGVWIEAQLNLRDKYENFIYGEAKKGRMGWSSGTAPNLVERAAVGKAYHIKHWPLGLDASLTPIPAEPRNVAVPLKSLTATESLEALLQGSGEDPADAMAPDAKRIALELALLELEGDLT